jgi:hypothetical protein
MFEDVYIRGHCPFHLFNIGFGERFKDGVDHLLNFQMFGRERLLGKGGDGSKKEKERKKERQNSHGSLEL